MPPDDVQVARRKTLFAPVTGRRDDGLVFADHVFEFLDRIERYFVFRVAEIHESAGVSAMLGKEDFDRSVGINRNDGGFFPTACQRKDNGEREPTFFVCHSERSKGIRPGPGLRRCVPISPSRLTRLSPRAVMLS